MIQNGVLEIRAEPVILPSRSPGAHPGWRRRWLPKALVMVIDVCSVAVAMAAALYLRPFLPGAEHDVAQLTYPLVAAVSLPVWLGFFFHYRLYTARCVSNLVAEFGRIIHAAGASVVVLGSAGFMFRVYFSRGWLVLTFLFAVVLLTVERYVVRRVFMRLRLNGRLLRSVVIVGRNTEGLSLAAMIDEDPGLGYRVVGFVDDAPSSDDPRFPSEQPLLGSVDKAVEAVQASGASGVIVATTSINFTALNRLVRELTEHGLHVELSSSLRDIAATRLTLRSLGRFPVTYLEPVRRHGWRARAKRSFDLVLASVTLVVTLPLLVVIALAIKVSSSGPVLFMQQRVGRGGVPFSMLKFRTMVPEAEERLAQLIELNESSGPLFKLKNDPRVTRVGRFLRATSLDELPQFLNVVRGQMSLVGPRPALPTEVSGWSPELHQRLAVQPGITGMWQVHGRNRCSFDDYTRLDLFYVDNWSLWTDLAILVKTVPAVLLRHGAS